MLIIYFFLAIFLHECQDVLKTPVSNKSPPTVHMFIRKSPHLPMRTLEKLGNYDDIFQTTSFVQGLSRWLSGYLGITKSNFSEYGDEFQHRNLKVEIIHVLNNSLPYLFSFLQQILSFNRRTHQANKHKVSLRKSWTNDKYRQIQL